MRTQGRAPLWEALLNYRQQRLNSWHTPGHKDGAYARPDWRQALGEETLGLDLTEVPGLDNLAHPAGVIREAQARAAAFYGAEQTFFLVNGATVGLMAVILATCRPGETVLLPRYAHRAVFNGLILSGARPVYLQTEWLPHPGIPLGVTPEALEQALGAHPGARLLLLVHPTYEGVVPRSRELIAMARARGLAVLVDAAHGAHFGLDPALPPAPLDLGADYVVQSTHKTMGALTQAAMLHVGKNGDNSGVAAALNLLQTSSPSYLLLASLDAARLLAEESGRRDWGRTVARALKLRQQLAAAGITCLEPAAVTGPAAAGLDVTRLLLPVASAGITGAQAAAILRAAGQEIELAGSDYILVLLTPGDDDKKVDSLRQALLALPRPTREAPAPDRCPGPRFTHLPALPRQAMTPREAWQAPRRALPLNEAAGRIAAELIAPCPPGLALLVPGEVINEETVHLLTGWMGPAGRVQVVDEG